MLLLQLSDWCRDADAAHGVCALESSNSMISDDSIVLLLNLHTLHEKKPLLSLLFNENAFHEARKAAEVSK